MVAWWPNALHSGNCSQTKHIFETLIICCFPQQSFPTGHNNIFAMPKIAMLLYHLRKTYAQRDARATSLLKTFISRAWHIVSDAAHASRDNFRYQFSVLSSLARY